MVGIWEWVVVMMLVNSLVLVCIWIFIVCKFCVMVWILVVMLVC